MNTKNYNEKPEAKSLQTEVYITTKTNVYCHGKIPPLDHPKVFLHLDEKNNTVICPYCSKKFIYREGS